jgi:hypothetical protein
MRYEPSIDYDQLIQAVVTAYQIPVTELTFIPVGFAAVCYRLRSHNCSYFLKLWLNSAPYDVRQPQRIYALRLARALYDRHICTHVAYPLYTSTGSLLHRANQGNIALFPFLEGSPMPEVWSAALQIQWTQLLIQLHRATPQLRDVLPAREHFSQPFVTKLQSNLRYLAQLGPNARPGLRAARARLLGAQHEIEAQVARLTALQQVVRQLPSPFVLCHTDMGSDNLLLGEAQQLYVLDWDEATVAPPEHDLHEARWLDFDRIIHTYRNKGGASPLYGEQFAFYILRRALADLTARLERLVTTNSTALEDADALDGIEAWGFQQWEALDTTLVGMQAALQ